MLLPIWGNRRGWHESSQAAVALPRCGGLPVGIIFFKCLRFFIDTETKPFFITPVVSMLLAAKAKK
jgi:hypothetical protein